MANPPPYTPIFSDAQNVAQAQYDTYLPMLAADTPPITPGPIDTYYTASADMQLLARGVQLRHINGLGSMTGSSTMPALPGTPAYVLAPVGSVAYTPKITRTYHLETRMSMWVSGVAGLVKLRYYINGTPYNDDEGAFLFNQTNTHTRVDFTVPIELTKDVAYTINWQWIGVNSQTLTVDANDIRVLRIWA